jgi:hypothetical protein
MAEKHPQTHAVNVGIVTNAISPIFQVPTGSGGITITEAWVSMETAGTAGLYLINAGAVGTATGAAGTLATYGGTAYTAKTPIEMTVASAPYIGEGSFVAVKEDNTGASIGTTVVSFTYFYGK